MSTAPTKFGEAHVGANSAPANFHAWEVLGFLVLAALGALAFFYTSAVFTLVAALAALGVSWWILVRLRRMGLELWQGLLIFTLTGYALLNYGFENIAIHIAGIPVIVSYGMIYGCLALAFYNARHEFMQALTEPTMLALFAILALAFCHLLFNIPQYGLLAFRDCTMFIDGLFMILGLLWARRATTIGVMIKWLMVINVINMLYSFTFPWSERIMAWSPASGVFMDVPILGQYHTTDIYLLTGAVFCLGLGRYMMQRRRWVMTVLAVIQLLGLAITQARASYVALFAFIILFAVIGERKKSRILLGMVASALLLLVVATSAGLQISGRIGPVNVSFLADHLRSITGAKVTAASTVQSRVDWTGEAMAHFYSSPIVGVGFGMPLIDYVDEETGAVVRFPHNSNISVLARLGAVGFVLWLLFHFSIVRRFVYAYTRRKDIDPQLYEFILWIFLMYLTVMIAALVEAPFEFPSSAVPLYFFTGLGLGLIRYHLPPKGARSKTLPWATPATELGARR